MKKIISIFTILFLLASHAFVSGCQCNMPDRRKIIKTDDEKYYINSDPESLELKMATGGIVFSRKNTFCIGVTYPGMDFFWGDNDKDFYISYQGTLCFDFNKDFVFDFFYQQGKSFIVFNHQRIEVNKPNFQTMRAVDLNGTKYHWDGSNWGKQP